MNTYLSGSFGSVPSPPRYGEIEKARLMLGLLESVERDGKQTQRVLAIELGAALGLVNAYLRRCINKGLVKAREAPARRYAYYLTPQGFAEKSRLTGEYLSYSFSFLRRARADYTNLLHTAKARSWTRVVLAGVSELAEIATICALEGEIEVVAIVDGNFLRDRFLGRAVVASFGLISEKFDVVIITDLRQAREMHTAAIKHCGHDRVLAPTLLGLANDSSEGGAER